MKKIRIALLAVASLIVFSCHHEEGVMPDCDPLRESSYMVDAYFIPGGMEMTCQTDTLIGIKLSEYLTFTELSDRTGSFQRYATQHHEPIAGRIYHHQRNYVSFTISCCINSLKVVSNYNEGDKSDVSDQYVIRFLNLENAVVDGNIGEIGLTEKPLGTMTSSNLNWLPEKFIITRADKDNIPYENNLFLVLSVVDDRNGKVKEYKLKL